MTSERVRGGDGVAGPPAATRVPTFAAVDLGASSGRVIVGRVIGEPGGEHVELHEVARFANGPVGVPGRRVDGHVAGETLHWDVLGLYREILAGLRIAAQRFGRLDAVGIDSWAVDYGLLDDDGALLGNPVHYRDARTDGVPDRVFAVVPAAELYARTGLQVQPFNTVFQLVAAAGSAQLAAARRALLVPDLLGYWLTGAEVAEVTNASTTGLLDTTGRAWATDVAERLGIDPGLLPPVCEPGTTVGEVRPEVRRDVAHPDPLPVVAVGSHDTASAVVAVPAAAGTRFAYVSCGTWSLVGLELDEPVLTEASRTANFTNELGVDGTVRYLRNVMGLWLLQESQRVWAAAGEPADLAELLAGAARVAPLTTVIDADDLEFLAPGDMPARIAAAAARTGQRPPRTPAETVRCILDSLALAYRRAVREAGRLAGREVDVVHMVGGGVRNELLCRLTAEATGLPVVAGPVEGAALGNVLVQARALGAVRGADDAAAPTLADLRAVAARSSELRRFAPTGAADLTEADWAAAERRLHG